MRDLERWSISWFGYCWKPQGWGRRVCRPAHGRGTLIWLQAMQDGEADGRYPLRARGAALPLALLLLFLLFSGGGGVAGRNRPTEEGGGGPKGPETGRIRPPTGTALI